MVMEVLSIFCRVLCGFGGGGGGDGCCVLEQEETPHTAKQQQLSHDCELCLSAFDVFSLFLIITSLQNMLIESLLGSRP